MTNTRNLSLAEVRAFLEAPETAKFEATNKAEAYGWIEDCLIHFTYWRLSRPEKGLVRRYIRRLTGYSRSQVNRLIGRWRTSGHIKRLKGQRTVFKTVYTREDISLLAKTDKLHNFLSGPATRVILKREYEFFGNSEYDRLAQISSSHIYNLRKHFVYQKLTCHFNHTKPVTSQIGERKCPDPGGQPGYIRVDTVHQGDSPGLGKGVYHINFVDEETQWEMVACVAVISETSLVPMLEQVIKSFPFKAIAFHSDNGSEYINKTVAKLLNKLHIEQTKSRPRHSNDNALAETKNGSVIRKEMGYRFIQKGAAKLINDWYRKYFNPYLNFHRPCSFATTVVDKKGRVRKKYRQENVMIPYEKLKSLEKAEQYLRDGITFAELNRAAYSDSDTEFAERMVSAKKLLSGRIRDLKGTDENNTNLS